MANAKVSTLTEISAPSLSDYEYAVQASGPTSGRLTYSRLLGLGGFIPGGRLTLTTGTPVTTSDVTAAGTLYYAPYLHDRIRIYDGTRWRVYTFTELSLSLTLTSGKNYDVFIYDNAGTLTLELSAAWTNDTTRADALTTQDGVQVKSGATTRLWLGTIRASGTNTTEDSFTKRFVGNAYNAVLRSMKTGAITSASHSYGTTTWREWNNGTSVTRLGFVAARPQSIIKAVAADVSSAAGYCGSNLDSTSADPDESFQGQTGPVRSNVASQGMVTAAGYHYICPMEYANAATTFSNYWLSGWCTA